MTTAPQKPVILIVEDDHNLRGALESLFTSEGYCGVTKSSGQEALQYNSCNLAGALLDIHLPDMNGLVLANILRTKYGPDLPIVVLSGDASMDTIRRLGDSGATYFFSKPVNPSLLMDYFQTALSKT